MRTISPYELHQREQKQLPTLIIDARTEEENYTFEFIDPRQVVALKGNVYAGKRMMPNEVSQFIPHIKKWAENMEGVLVVVTCTRFINHCPRIGSVMAYFEKENIPCAGLDPHVYEWMNGRMNQKIAKANL